MDNQRGRNFFRNVSIILVILVLAMGGVSFYFWSKFQNALSNPSQVTSVEVANLINKVSKIMLLPANEQPSLANIDDLSSLKTQPFFVNAMVGDKLLVFNTSKVAILYRPSENKIIQVGPINVNPPSQSAQPTPNSSDKSNSSTASSSKK